MPLGSASSRPATLAGPLGTDTTHRCSRPSNPTSTRLTPSCSDRNRQAPSAIASCEVAHLDINDIVYAFDDEQSLAVEPHVWAEHSVLLSVTSLTLQGDA